MLMTFLNLHAEKPVLEVRENKKTDSVGLVMIGYLL